MPSAWAVYVMVSTSFSGKEYLLNSTVITAGLGGRETLFYQKITVEIKRYLKWACLVLD